MSDNDQIVLGLTLAINMEVSKMDLMCLRWPLPSRPDRKALIDGFFSSQTENSTQNNQITTNLNITC